MATDNDMLDLEVLNSILNDRKTVQVGWDQDVGDVTVAEDVTRLKTQDGRFRATRVGTSNPKDLGCLTFAEFGEDLWMRFT